MIIGKRSKTKGAASALPASIKIKDILLPNTLWTSGFTDWWVVSLLTVLGFDLFWMGQTTFRTFEFLPFWPFLFLSSTLLAFPCLFMRRGWLNALVLLIADIVMIANLMYGRTYFNAIPYQSYMLVGNLADFTESVADSFKWYFAALPLFTIAAWAGYEFLICKSRRYPDAVAYFALIGFLTLLCWAADIWRGGTRKHIEQMHSSAYESSCVPTVYTLPGFLAYDILKSSESLTPADGEKVRGWLEYHKQLSAYPSSDSIQARKKPKNMVLLLCESLEGWPIETRVEGKELTPYLNSLIADSTTFFAPRVISQAANGRSIEGQLLILSGMLPMRNKVYAYDAADNTYFSIPKAMKEAGGRSYLVTCDKPYVWNQIRVAEAFGMDTVIYSTAFVIDEQVGAARRISDGSLMRQTVGKLKKGELWPEGEKAFLMMVTYAGHNPFRIPEKLKEIKFDEEYPEILKDYMTALNYTDNSLATIIEYLKSRSDWEDTMVVITGDHEGLAADRREAVAHPLSSMFVDAAQHTPLIILNAPNPGRYEGEMGEVDIYSTIVDLMGWGDYAWQGMGMSVANPSFPGVAIDVYDQTHGDEAATDSVMLRHLCEARDVSDLILRFDMFRH